MKPVHAQFVERRGPSGLIWALMLAGLFAAGWMQYRAYAVDAEQQAQRLRLAQLAREEAEATARAPKTPLPYAESLKEIERLRDVAWPQLLVALEVVPRGDLQINSIEVDVVTRRTDVAVAASSTKAVLDYVDLLNAGVPPGVSAWRWGAWRVAERPGSGFSVELRAVWGQE
jgi:hypothetical protein